VTLPAACAECMETVQLSLPGALLQQLPTRLFRSLEGQLRFDFGTMSLVIDPIAGIRMMLDHVALEARMLAAAVQLPGMPGMPGMPQMPGMAMPPIPSAGVNFNIVKLGKAILEGLEVEGIQYVFAILDPLKPPPITLWEIWTSTKLQLPVMTKIIGAFGQRINICKCVGVPPPPTAFQVPPGYTVIPPPSPMPPTPPAIPTISTPSGPPAMPPTPTMPSVPGAPSAPARPSMPNLPSASPLPNAPNVPSAPALPRAPSVPTAPVVPAPPAVTAPSLPGAPSTPSAPALPNLPTLPKP